MSDDKCERCDGTGWLEPIGPCSDGSYITSRPCPNCDGEGIDRLKLWRAKLRADAAAFIADLPDTGD